MALAQSDSAPRPYSSRLVCPRGCSAGMFIFSTFRRFAWQHHPGSLRPGLRTSNYEGGGIGACSVGTYRKDFSVTFRQQRAEDIAPAFEAISRFATRSRPRMSRPWRWDCDCLRRSRKKFQARFRVHLRGSWCRHTAISIRSLVTR